MSPTQQSLKPSKQVRNNMNLIHPLLNPNTHTLEHHINLELSRLDFNMPLEKNPEYKDVPINQESHEALVRTFVKDVKPEHAYVYVMSKVVPYGLDADKVEVILDNLGVPKPRVTVHG